MAASEAGVGRLAICSQSPQCSETRRCNRRQPGSRYERGGASLENQATGACRRQQYFYELTCQHPKSPADLGRIFTALEDARSTYAGVSIRISLRFAGCPPELSRNSLFRSHSLPAFFLFRRELVQRGSDHPQIYGPVRGPRTQTLRTGSILSRSMPIRATRSLALYSEATSGDSNWISMFYFRHGFPPTSTCLGESLASLPPSARSLVGKGSGSSF